LIGYYADEANAIEKVIEIASKYDRLPDREKVARGESAKSGWAYDPDFDDMRKEWENSDEGRETINNDFNEELESFAPENADSKIFNLGNPSDILLKAGIENKPLKLYGSKLLKKINKHGFNAIDLKDLPKAINDPIAIFKGNRPDSFAILTEIAINGNNVLASLEVGKSSDVDFNMITSAYGKASEGISNWINEGKLLYENKEKSLDYFGTSAPIADAGSQGSTNKYTKIPEEKQGKTEKTENTQKYTDLEQKEGDKPSYKDNWKYDATEGEQMKFKYYLRNSAGWAGIIFESGSFSAM